MAKAGNSALPAVKSRRVGIAVKTGVCLHMLSDCEWLYLVSADFAVTADIGVSKEL